MNTEQNNFEELRDLLKLKRYEIPPPRYFNEFSGNVVASIRAGKNRASLTDETSLLNFFNLFRIRPGVLGGLATSICALLFIGVIVADHSDSAPQDFLTISPTVAPGAPLANAMTASTLAPAAVNTGIVASTNPVTSLQPVASLFGQASAPSLFQPASFSSAGN